MTLIYEGSKDQALIDMALRSFASLYTEDDFEIDEKKISLKITKGTFLNSLDADNMTINQSETVNYILKLLWTIWNGQMLIKSRRLSMSLPTKRTLSNDSETKVGPNPQKTKNENKETIPPKSRADQENPKNKNGREDPNPLKK